MLDLQYSPPSTTMAADGFLKKQITIRPSSGTVDITLADSDGNFLNLGSPDNCFIWDSTSSTSRSRVKDEEHTL
ncbi:hypothetical protein ACH5RR_036953 [Cinchona calisaya]|uniref:Uncharacterized protein n=1 Tax=Cinchona calisaya TaxID=153742 RepID=A0ABD2Y954_9GENT